MAEYATAIQRSTVSTGFFGGGRIEKQGNGVIHAVPWSKSGGSASRTICDTPVSGMEHIAPDDAGTWPAAGVTRAIECGVCASEVRKNGRSQMAKYATAVETWGASQDAGNFGPNGERERIPGASTLHAWTRPLPGQPLMTLCDKSKPDYNVRPAQLEERVAWPPPPGAVDICPTCRTKTEQDP